MWSASMILSIAADALKEGAAALDAEQAPKGLEARSEVQLHPLLAAAFRRAGLGVACEQPYPGEWRRPGQGPKASERERCDLVLTPEGSGPLLDPLGEARRAEAERATLFAGRLAEPGGTEPEEAFWLEVKTVAQYAYVEGVPGPNRAWGSLLTQAGRDLAKLGREERVMHGGVLLVLFTADPATAEHDLEMFCHRALDRGCRLSSPVWESFAIADRVGNAWCTVALTPVAG